MLRHSMQLLLFAFLVTCTLRAAEDPFIGDWKLNPSKSTLTDQMTVKSVAGNQYLVDVGRGFETVVVNGPDQPRSDGSTVSVTSEGPNTWRTVQKKAGRVVLSAIWKLSKDGNTLTDNLNVNSANGSISTVNYVFQRKGGGSGFAGTWVSTSVDVNFVLVMQIRPFEGSGLSVTAEGNTRNVKFDGKDNRRPDEHTLELTDKGSDGKIADTQRIQLSPDLKTLTMTTRIPGRSDPQILVFERQ